MTTKTFALMLGQAVALALSGEKGIVVGRAEYDNSEDGYYVRYVDANGCQQSEWFGESAIEAVEAVTDRISPEAAAAAQHAGTAAITGQAERDVNGLPWDARIHSSSKNKNGDGSWRNRKGVDKATLAKVEAELKATVAAPATIAATATNLPPPPVAAVPAIPALPIAAVAAAPNPVYTNFVAFLAQHTKSEQNPTGRITPEWVQTVLRDSFGIPNGDLQNLAHKPEAIPAIEAAIKNALGLA